MSISTIKQQQCIILQPNPQPDWDNFVTWGKQLLASIGINEINLIDCGADRHKLTFTFGQNRFSLNYENYSDSYWVEIDEPAAIDYLDQLDDLITASDIEQK